MSFWAAEGGPYIVFTFPKVSMTIFIYLYVSIQKWLPAAERELLGDG